MPSQFELLCAIRFDRLTGLRPYGHFDHDATCMTGPKHVHSDALLGGNSQDLCPVEHSHAMPFEEAFEDPWTGEISYRPRSGSNG
jgi:hypothetical protein